MKYISPSALRVWERDREEFYLFYLAECPLARAGQMQAAAIGSAFDARVKSSLARAIYGNTCPVSLQFEPLFAGQVGEDHQDWAREASLYAFQAYVDSGRYTELLALLQTGTPTFEGKLDCDVEGVPIRGLPDCMFISASGIRCVLDWKVKGFCSKYPKSPTKQHIMCRDGFAPNLAKGIKQSRGHGKPHKDAKLITVDGLTVHQGWMEDADEYYADQLAMYLWCLGESPATSNHIVIIDELVCKPYEESYPLVRVSTLASRISNSYQTNLLVRLKRMWGQLQSGHIFEELPYAASTQRCKELDRIAMSQSASGSPTDDEFSDYLRSQFIFGK